MPRYSIIVGFLGQTRDRFHTYNKPIDLDEKLRILKSIPGYTGAEIVYPYDATDPDDIRALLEKHAVEISMINVNVKAEPEFLTGGITSSRKEVREKAIKFIKEAKDFAAAIGAPGVTCCPLGDGFEFPFQTDYRKAWKYLCDAFGEGAAHRPEMPLYVEYKPKETRRQCFIDRAADTLCLFNDIGADNLGVTIDFGHSIYAGEHPAQALSLVHDSGRPYYVHINDNDKTWDWDFFTGSHNLLEYIEFLFYLKVFGYDGFLTSDTHPTRWDMTRMFEINSRLTEKIWLMLDAVGLERLVSMLDNEDYTTTWQLIESEILGFK